MVKWNDYQPLIRLLEGDAGACCPSPLDLRGAGLGALAVDKCSKTLPALFTPPIDVALVALHLISIYQVSILINGFLDLLRISLLAECSNSIWVALG